MSIGLLLPMGLVALAALIVPLLIHLVRRPEQASYDFPALRWLSESERPRRRPRLDELALLLLRLLLLALMALLLAVPILRGEWRDARHWVLASNAIDLDAARNTVSDKQADWRWLAPGFPRIEEDRPTQQQAFASLVREFEANLPPSDTLSVLAPAEIGGLDAERIALGRNVDWVVVPASSNAASASVEDEVTKVSIRFENKDQESIRYVRAALAALEAGEPLRWKIDEALDSVPVNESTDAVVWLGATWPDALQVWIAAGGRALVVDPQAQSGAVILRDRNGEAIARDEALGKGEVVRILKPLTPDNLPMLLDAEFPAQLRALIKGPNPAPASTFAANAAPRFVERAARVPTTKLSGLLCFLIAIVFLLERILATRRRRAT